MRRPDADLPATHVLFEGVRKSYGAFEAVRGLDLAIEKGEFLTLLGPSGSGKTTALMLLAGFEEPSAGRIFLDGARIDRLAANRRNLGLVFQNYALFPHMTVAENLAYPLKVRRIGRAEREARVLRALDLVRLGGLGARRPDQLSGGQQQRVAVARALIFEPALVLMDEPLGALDRHLREQMQAELKSIHDRLGVTFLYVTHDQAEALALSDRIAVFAEGRAQQVASPRVLYEAPATGFVAGFIGESNRLAGTVESLSEGIARLRLASGERVPALAAQGLGIGAEAWISLRPERLRLCASPEPAAGEVRLAGRLGQISYGGDHLRLVVHLGAGQSLAVKLPLGGASGEAGVETGAQVTLGWEISAGRAFPAA